MISIHSLIQNAKQLSKSYEKNAMNAEGVIQQMANFAGATAPQQQQQASQPKQSNSAQASASAATRPNEQQPSTPSYSATTATEHSQPSNATNAAAAPVITDPKVMIASLLEQEQQAAAVASRKFSASAAAASTSSACLLVPGSSSTCKPRSLVMHAIQRESPRVKALRKENHLLKQQLQEYQFALELIMSKYREQMMQLLTQAEACCTSILSHHESPEQMEQQAKTIALTNRLQDMKVRFERSIGPSSEEKILEQRQLLHELIVEHETLVELYQISKKYGSLPGATQDTSLDAGNLVSTTEALMEALKVVEMAATASTTFSAVEQQSSNPESENEVNLMGTFSRTSMEAESEAETEKENLNPELESPMDLDSSQEGNAGLVLAATVAAAAVAADV